MTAPHDEIEGCRLSHQRLAALVDGVVDTQVHAQSLLVAGGQHAIELLPFRRWREVEVHLVDLGLGVTPADWPAGLVERALPRLLASLGGRSDERALMAWALGRGTAPDLDPWA